MLGPIFQPLKNRNDASLFSMSFAAGIILSFVILSLGVFIFQTQNTVFPPKTYFENIDVSGLTKQDALTEIKNELEQNNKTDFEITLKVEESTVASLPATEITFPAKEIGFRREIDQNVSEAFDQFHKNISLLTPGKLFFTLTQEKRLVLKNAFDQEKVASQAAQLAQKIDREGHDASATLGKSGKENTLKIDPGEIGLQLDQEKTVQLINQALLNKKDNSQVTINPAILSSHQHLDQDQLTQAKKRATYFVGKTIDLKNNDHRDVHSEITDQQIIKTLTFPEGYKTKALEDVTTVVNDQIKRDPQNAIFDYKKDKDGKIIVKDFQPHKTGLAINSETFTQNLQAFLEKKEERTTSETTQNQQADNENSWELTLPLSVTQPEITLADTNDLGIKELIGFGDSEYDHSIPNRIHNVAITTQKINWTVVAPGEEFRFNNTLGEVSKQTGYRSAYVISDGKTVLGDGGGVCQVSTTVFRAALNAGLPITKRKAHSYRVSYYELNSKPGVDATVYAGDVDLRFKNDTGHYILINGQTNSEELYMKIEIYGTSDGRTAEIVDHKTWDYRPPPPPAYYPTTDLPHGKVQQIDWAVSGIKASFKNVVKDKDGNIIRTEEYYSNYIPWSAKYLVGE